MENGRHRIQYRRRIFKRVKDFFNSFSHANRTICCPIKVITYYNYICLRLECIRRFTSLIRIRPNIIRITRYLNENPTNHFYGFEWKLLVILIIFRFRFTQRDSIISFLYPLLIYKQINQSKCCPPPHLLKNFQCMRYEIRSLTECSIFLRGTSRVNYGSRSCEF